MKRRCLFGVVVLLGGVATSAQAQWGYPPPGYRPPLIVQPDGTPAPCAARYGLCSAWKRKHGCDKPSFADRIRARCGLGDTP